MKNKKRVFDFLTILFAVVLIAWLSEINYNDLSSKENISAYLGIFSSIIFIFVMQFTKKNLKDKNQ